MTNALLTLKSIRIGYDAEPLIEGAECVINKGDKIALVGRNGAGKSTLMRLMAGQLKPDHGDYILTPNTRIAFMEQDPDPKRWDTLEDFVTEGLAEIESKERQRALTLLVEMGLDPMADPVKLSGGEFRRAALAKAFAANPDLLLMDEPTNHLDIDAILWLEDRLKTFRGGLIVISHDRTFLENVSNGCLWVIAKGLKEYKSSYKDFPKWMKQEVQRELAEDRRHKQHLKAELRYLERGVTGRRRRNTKRMATLSQLKENRQKFLLGQARMKIKAEEGERSGTQVIKAHKVAKSYDDKKLFSDFSTIIRYGDRIGIIGRNGAGKSTLLNILTGNLSPDQGGIKLGAGLQTLFIDQKKQGLGEGGTVRTVLTGGENDQVIVHEKARHVIAYMKDFLFDKSYVDTPINSLSGGERSRLLLAREFAKPANLLILDEPTNDLDMDSLDMLEEVIAEFDGTVLLVSHDRAFLDKVVFSTIVLEGDGTVAEYPGGYSDYLRQRKAKPNTSKAKPVASAATDAIAPQNARTPKLTYKQTQAIENLPVEIKDLTQKIERFEKTLSDPNLYTDDPEKFDTVSKALAIAKVQVAKKEDEWLELEILRQEIEDSKA